MGAFGKCTLLHKIVIPIAVKAIKMRRFFQCSRLVLVNLGEVLEEIGTSPFAW